MSENNTPNEGGQTPNPNLEGNNQNVDTPNDGVFSPYATPAPGFFGTPVNTQGITPLGMGAPTPNYSFQTPAGLNFNQNQAENHGLTPNQFRGFTPTQSQGQAYDGYENPNFPRNSQFSNNTPMYTPNPQLNQGYTPVSFLGHPGINNAQNVFQTDNSSPFVYPAPRNAVPFTPRVIRNPTLDANVLEEEEYFSDISIQRGDIHSTYIMPSYSNENNDLGFEAVTQFNNNVNNSVPATPVSGLVVNLADSQVIWGTTVNIQEVKDEFMYFLQHYTVDYYKKDQNLQLQPQDTSPYYPPRIESFLNSTSLNLNLDCQYLFSFPRTKKLFYQLQRYPQEVIPILDHTLNQYFKETFGATKALKIPLKIRPFNVGTTVNMRLLDPSDIDKLVTVKGLLIRASSIIPDLKIAAFQCSSCDMMVRVGISRGTILEPTQCSNQSCMASGTMRIVHNRCVFTDKQVCKLQETPDAIPDGQTPHAINLCLYDDMVDTVKPGDRLEITGIFRSTPTRINSRHRVLKSLFKTYLDVVNIKVVELSGVASSTQRQNQESDPALTAELDTTGFTQEEINQFLDMSTTDDIYSKLANSLAPSIFGHDDVKKGILLQLFGGSTRIYDNPSTPNSRGDMHILLVGDPGTAKSQMLQYAHRIAPRGMYTSGKGSSAVGLTAYVTRDPDTNQLVLESGALVLSDGGLCCIDEFDKMHDSTRSILHEVMEQQTVSVAKAGIIASLNARTSILACANPIKSRYDHNLSVPENINLQPALLSRFDLIYLLLDQPDEDADRELARHLVNLFLDPSLQQQADQGPLDLVTLSRYIAYARQNCKPILNDAAADKLKDIYVRLRKAGIGNHRQETRITATARQLESLIRLSEAHAKMRLSKEVTIADVDEAHRLLMAAIKDVATDAATGLVDMSILTTGKSNLMRSRLRDIKRIVIQVLASMENDDEVKMSRLLELVNRHQDSNGNERWDSNTLHTACEELKQERELTIRTDPDRRFIVKRNFSAGYSYPEER